jgi:hypothetical protein
LKHAPRYKSTGTACAIPRHHRSFFVRSNGMIRNARTEFTAVLIMRLLAPLRWPQLLLAREILAA